LIDKQAAEKADLKRRWQSLNQERRRAFSVLKRQGGYRKAAEASPEAQEGLEGVQTTQASKKTTGKRRGRVRRRKRE
jgi:hypothetical protein